MENEKKGISQINGKTEIKLGEKAFYKVARIHRMEDHDKVKNALWKLYVKEKGAWRELKPNPSAPPKKGDEVPLTITNQSLVGKELLVEAYIYEPEMKAPPGLKIKVVAGGEKKIQRVELFMVDDTPIKEDTILKYNQTIKVKVYTQNMPNELLKLSLYEDDADGGGHNPKNEKNKVAEAKKATNDKGFLWYEFKLNAEFSKIANAMMDGSHDKLHEYYVLVESVKYGNKASKNIEVENPDYVVHQTYENGKVTDHKNDKIYEGGQIEEVIIKGKYKKQMGIDPIPKTGRSVSIVQEPPEKKEEKETCICKDEYKLIWGNKLTCSQRKKVVDVCKNIWGDDKKIEKANELMAILHLETVGSFSPSKKGVSKSGTSFIGLIQFSETTAKSLGTSYNALGKMTFNEQMVYVEKYLKQNKDKMSTIVDFYLQVIKPSDVGKGTIKDHAVFDESITVPDGNGSSTSKEQRLININKEPWVTKYGYASNPTFMFEDNEKVTRKRWVYTRQTYEDRYGNIGGKTYIWEIEKALKDEHYKPGESNKYLGTCENTPEEKPKSEGKRAPWVDVAFDEFEKFKGLVEKESPLKERISEYFKVSSTGSKKANGTNWGYKDPWCGAFLAWCFEQTNDYKKINTAYSAQAFGWNAEKWKNGEKSEVFVGSIIVFDFSHVAILVGENKTGDKYVYLGGNQGNGDGRSGYQKISLGSISKNSKAIIAITKPKNYTIDEDEKQLPKYDVNAENTKSSSR